MQEGSGRFVSLRGVSPALAAGHHVGLLPERPLGGSLTLGQGLRPGSAYFHKRVKASSWLHCGNHILRSVKRWSK